MHVVDLDCHALRELIGHGVRWCERRAGFLSSLILVELSARRPSRPDRSCHSKSTITVSKTSCSVQLSWRERRFLRKVCTASGSCRVARLPSGRLRMLFSTAGRSRNASYQHGRFVGAVKFPVYRIAYLSFAPGKSARICRGHPPLRTRSTYLAVTTDSAGIACSLLDTKANSDGETRDE